MKFDDYNYELFNKYILIDPKKPAIVSDKDEPAIKEMVGFSLPNNGVKIGKQL